MKEDIFIPKLVEKKQKNNSQEKLEKNIIGLKKEVDLGPKSSDKDYTAYEKKKNDSIGLENQKKELNSSAQGETMGDFIKREYNTDVKTPEEKQGENVEAFLDKEYDADNKKEANFKKEKSQVELESETLEMYDLELEKEDEIIDLEDLEDPKMKELASKYEKAQKDYMDKKRKLDGILNKVRNVLGVNMLFKKENSSDLQNYKEQYEKARNEMLDYKYEKTKNLPDEIKKQKTKRFAHYQEQGSVLKGDRAREAKEVKKKVENKEDDTENSRDKKDNFENENNNKEEIPSNKENEINLMEKYGLNKDDEPIVIGGKLIKKMSLGLSENWRSIRDLKFTDLEEKISPKLKKNIEKVVEDLVTLWGDEIRPDKNKKETVQTWLARAINNSLDKKEKNRIENKSLD